MKTANTLVIGILSITTALAVQAQTFITNGLVAYYPFNGNASDASGNGNNGIVDGATFTTNRFGQANSALLFNSSNENVVTTSFMPPTGTSSRTFSLWFNTTYTNEQAFLYYGGFNDYPGDMVEMKLLNVAGPVKSGAAAFGTSYATSYSTSTWNDGNWHQFTMVIPTNAELASVSIYIDGALQPTLLVYNFDSLVYINTLNAYALTFGAVETGKYDYYSGLLDDVRIYNRALSTNEVAELYAYESTPQTSFLTNDLVVYLPLHGNASDASGNGNNGTNFNVTYRPNRFGVAGAAAEFNGTSSLISVTNLFSSEPTQLTYSIWFSPANNLSQTNAPFFLATAVGPGGNPNVGGSDYSVGQFSDNLPNNGPIHGGYPGFGMYKYENWANYYYCDVTNFLFLNNQWHQVVGVYTASSMTLYLDGTLQKTLQYAIGGGGLQNLDIGNQFPGSISDVRVYFTALTSDDVAALYTIESAPPTTPPNIISQPVSETVNQNSEVSFGVTATGSGLDYQWLFNGTNICSATNTSYSLTDLSTNNAGIYTVIVSNAGGSVTSSNAVLTVIPPPRAGTGTATLDYDFVVYVSITDGGTGYTNTPLVRLIGGGGTGAGAFAVVSNGVITSITITNAGYDYTNAPVVVIDPPFISNPVLGIAAMSFLSFSNLTVGGDYQLQQFDTWYWTNQPLSFTALNTLYTQMFPGVVGGGEYRLALNPVPTQSFATPVVSYGFVVSATVTSGGSGYVTSPAVSIVGGGGTNATAVSQISGGVVTRITITDAGIGYTNTPTVRIAAPPAAAVYPNVQPVMQVNSSNLAPYDNYEILFTPILGQAWENWNGGLFSPTAATNSQFIFITNDIGYLRLQYVP